MAHSDDAICPVCEYKLESVHNYLTLWFRALKRRYPNVHIDGFCPDALELYQEDEDGVERRGTPFTKLIDAENKTNRDPITMIDGWFKLKTKAKENLCLL